MERPELQAFLSIISHKRSSNVGPMEALVGPATWVVGKGEAEEYKAAGATAVIEGGPLCASRNAGLKAAWDVGMAGLQLSDDLNKVQSAVVIDGKKKARDITFEEAASELRIAQMQTGAKLAGAAPTSNPFYWNPNKPIHPAAFIVGDIIRVMPCHLWFDTGMTLKEDYDYTLAHLHDFGLVARVNGLLAHFLHRTNPGGAVAARTAELEQENIAYLRKKWGRVIADNPRRPNEILLKLPKQR